MRDRFRTNSKELIKLIKDTNYTNLAFDIAHEAISRSHELIEADEEKLDSFRNHRRLRYDDVVGVYVGQFFDQIGCELPDKYVVDYD